MRILCAIYHDMYYDRSMHSLEMMTFWPACQEIGEARLFPIDWTRQSILMVAMEFKPDVILVVPVKDEMVDLTGLGIPSLGWICDSYRDGWLSGELRKYTHLVGTDERAELLIRSAGKPFKRTTWATNPHLYVPKQKDLDIVWVGQNSAWRRDYIKAFEKAFGSRFVCRGLNFPGGHTTWDEYLDLFGSAKIGLSLSLDMVGLPHGKLRPFEIASCGGLVLSQTPNTLAGYLDEGTEYVPFCSPDEAVEKAAYYLEHDEERQAIAHAARERVLRESTFKHRLEEAFAWMTSP